jgi:hypothetical protein
MKEIITAIIMVFVVSIGVQNISAQQVKFSRSTFKAKTLVKSPFWHIRVFEDRNYIFVYRSYGSNSYVPGFFIYGKRKHKWIEIKELSTENAKLGSSPPYDEVVLAVAWNYKNLKKFDYVNVVLRTSGSINLPDKIEYDKVNQAYRLNYNSVINLEKSLTVFWLLRKEIEKSFS